MKHSEFKILIMFLGTTVLMVGLGGIVLATLKIEVPELLQALGSGALGALSTAFVRPPGGDPQPVVIEGEPVQVETTTEAAAGKRARRR